MATLSLVTGIFGAVTASAAPAADTKWVEGRNYFPIVPARSPGLPAGKVQVTEVFSYACPACNQFQPYMRKLEHSVPSNVIVNFIPASFNPAEDWPMFQLAYVTAQALGIADKTHDAMFDAVWTTGELATTDPATGGLKSHMPTIEDAARFYEKRAGVPVAKFLATSKSFGVDNQVRIDEEAIKQFGVDRTPTIVVNGKYRLQVESAGGPDGLIELVNWLVAKESK
ncbi:MAG TPA: thiol:disulfide interchange protein DsbA/DsbL [Steroidobacteraceae bacterium]|nr:thiol:disulfide interchange protein DsbA/DsbL [Steroidobacteraceae bacterium]